MPLLASQQVIDAARAALIGAATTSGDRVYSGRFHPIAEFPSTRLVHVGEEVSVDGDDITWPPSQLHRLQIDVEVHVRGAADLDGAMADAALQVLQALQSSPNPLGLAGQGVTLQAVRISYTPQADGQAVIGKAAVRFEAEFSTAANAPHTII